MKTLKRAAGIVWGIMATTGFALLVKDKDFIWFEVTAFLLTIYAILNIVTFLLFLPFRNNKEELSNLKEYFDKSTFYYNGNIFFFFVGTVACVWFGSYWLAVAMAINTLGFEFDKNLTKVVKSC
jgi:hypothetical protein